MNDRQVRDEVMTLLLAGHETTANTLTWTWYLLSHVFVKDIGDQYRIRIGAIIAHTFDNDNQIWGPFDTEKRKPAGRC
jgi:hypothetical protein